MLHPLSAALSRLAKAAPGNAPSYLARPGADTKAVVSGIDCHVERMPGDVRHGKILQTGYGYIPGTLGADGEALDCYIGPNALSGVVFIIDQLDDDGDIDEHKVMLGFDSAEDAAHAFVRCLPSARMGAMYSATAGDFLLWLQHSPDVDDEPFGRIAERTNLRVGYFGSEFEPSAAGALIPASQQNPAM